MCAYDEGELCKMSCKKNGRCVMCEQPVRPVNLPSGLFGHHTHAVCTQHLLQVCKDAAGPDFMLEKKTEASLPLGALQQLI